LQFLLVPGICQINGSQVEKLALGSCIEVTFCRLKKERDGSESSIESNLGMQFAISSLYLTALTILLFPNTLFQILFLA